MNLWLGSAIELERQRTKLFRSKFMVMARPQDTTLYVILRAVVSIKCSYLLKFDEIAAYNVAQVECDSVSYWAIMHKISTPCNDYPTFDHTK